MWILGLNGLTAMETKFYLEIFNNWLDLFYHLPNIIVCHVQSIPTHLGSFIKGIVTCQFPQIVS